MVWRLNHAGNISFNVPEMHRSSVDTIFRVLWMNPTTLAGVGSNYVFIDELAVCLLRLEERIKKLEDRIKELEGEVISIEF